VRGSRGLVRGVWQHTQVASPTPVGLRPSGGRRHQRAAGRTRHRIGKASDDTVDGRCDVTPFAHRVGQGDEVVLVRMRGQRPRVANQFPTARGGDPAGVHHAQIPRMRFGDRGQRPHDGRRVRVDEGQRRDRIVGAPGPTAATGNVHSGRLSCTILASRRTRAVGGRPISNRYDLAVAKRGYLRSRRGREMRGPLLPPTVPGWRSRAERFDMAVLEAYEPIERRWSERLSGLDVAVDEIPRISPKDPESVQWPPEVIADGPIALARLIPAGVDVRGNATRARIVLFRKPIERRAKDTVELEELLHEILVAQVATYLGVEPSVIDPTIDDD
jgi:hypothetical protein